MILLYEVHRATSIHALGESPLLPIPRAPSAQSPTEAQQLEKDSLLLAIPKTSSARNELEYHTSLITARRCGRQIHFPGWEHFNDGLIQLDLYGDHTVFLLLLPRF